MIKIYRNAIIGSIILLILIQMVNVIRVDAAEFGEEEYNLTTIDIATAY